MELSLGYFLKAYDEYLDGERAYEDLPDFPHGSQRAHAKLLVRSRRRIDDAPPDHDWTREVQDTWGRYANETFTAPPPPPPEPRAEPEVIELKPRRWWWPWRRVREVEFGQAYVDTQCCRRQELPSARVVKR